MAKKSVGKGKAGGKTIVVCPKCGGREFLAEYYGTITTSNIRPVEKMGEETIYQFEFVGLGKHYFVEPVFTCTTCETEVVL